MGKETMSGNITKRDEMVSAWQKEQLEQKKSFLLENLEKIKRDILSGDWRNKKEDYAYGGNSVYILGPKIGPHEETIIYAGVERDKEDSTKINEIDSFSEIRKTPDGGQESFTYNNTGELVRREAEYSKEGHTYNDTFDGEGALLERYGPMDDRYKEGQSQTTYYGDDGEPNLIVRRPDPGSGKEVFYDRQGKLIETQQGSEPSKKRFGPDGSELPLDQLDLREEMKAARDRQYKKKFGLEEKE